MTKAELERLEESLMKLVSQRQALGGFDTNAEAILALASAAHLLTQHLREKTPREKERKRG